MSLSKMFYPQLSTQYLPRKIGKHPNVTEKLLTQMLSINTNNRGIEYITEKVRTVAGQQINKKFLRKIVKIFLLINFNICFGCSLRRFF